MDVPARVGAARAIGPCDATPTAGTDEQAEMGAEPPGRGVVNPEFIDPQPEDIVTLKTLALHDADPQRRLAAVTLLATSDDPDAIPVLAQALSDHDEDVRMAAVQALAEFTGEDPIDGIETALDDPSADVRYEALEVLWDTGGERARRAVQRALYDPDEDVQELAQSILEFELDDEEPRQ
jgi:HEAT repeat protein